MVKTKEQPEKKPVLITEAEAALKRSLLIAQIESARVQLEPLGRKLGWLTDEDVFKAIS